MSVLSIEEINNSFPDNRYMLNVIHNPNLWSEIDIDTLPNPEKVKFDENIKSNIPLNIKDEKGIYMFILEPNYPFEPSIKHLVYIGRVRSGTTNFSFFKRFNDYTSLIGNPNGSLNKVLLTNLWPNNTYVYFYKLDSVTDEKIAEIEDNLIKKIIPPLNSAIGGKTEQTRDLY
jgi:hypothetical protein